MPCCIPLRDYLLRPVDCDLWFCTVTATPPSVGTVGARQTGKSCPSASLSLQCHSHENRRAQRVKKVLQGDTDNFFNVGLSQFRISHFLAKSFRLFR